MMLKPSSNNLLRKKNGFTIIETLVAVGAGVILIGAASVGLKNLKSIIGHSSNLSSLRNQAITGQRILRTEIQKSQHLMVYGGNHDEGLEYTDLSNPIYKQSVSQCRNQTPEGQVFNPLFGLKSQNISDVRDVVVIYGFGVSESKQNYSLLRCGEALDRDGGYLQNSLTITPVLGAIGLVNCGPTRECKQNKDLRTSTINLANIANEVNTWLTINNQTAFASLHQPALGIKTDRTRRVLEFIDPTVSGDHINQSFLQAPGSRTGTVDLNMVAFARSQPISKTVGTDYGKGPCFYGICDQGGDLSAYQGLMFVVDVSGSMEGSRLNKLKRELKKTINDLPDGATISLSKFNQRETCHKNCTLISLNSQSRSEIIRFIDNMKAKGGTNPWRAIDRAIQNKDGKKLYLMTDGIPVNFPCESYYCQKAIEPTLLKKISSDINKNNRRENSVQINTINAFQRNQQWLEEFSRKGGGTYKRI